ncbi:MAG: transcription antitermination factor NusB [Candidatus Palauibacterales bacterium]|nr:transcription antitermination factor NusB [Candidatus Palauibacterales bacterium]MDP2483498.1 transcription antitermination factor NusB [Candidatus Palauibacterales bacterium]
MRPANPRSRARSWVLQVLYGWDTAGDGTVREWARDALHGRSVSPRYRPYIDRLLHALEEHLPECDSRIEASMPNWRLNRLSAIDRNILRIGTVEMMAIHDVPPRVAIHEAIRLAERYGSTDSPGFVNGVLDAVGRAIADS